MARPPYAELLAVSALLLAAAEATWAYYPTPDPGPLLASAGLLALYAAATSGDVDPVGSALLTAVAALAAASPVLPPPSALALAAASSALAISRGGTRRALLALASSVAFAAAYPFIPLLASAALLAAERRPRRAHALLLPVGYAASAVLGVLGMRDIAASLEIASAAALAAYSGRLRSCPFRADRPMTSAGLAALALLVPLSAFLPQRVLLALSAASIYVLAAGLLAPAGSSEMGLSAIHSPPAG